MGDTLPVSVFGKLDNANAGSLTLCPVVTGWSYLRY